MPLTITPLAGIPLINPGDSLPDVIENALIDNGISLFDNDILVLAQKIVSKAENRLVNLATITPSARAHELSRTTEKDPRLVELMLQESREILRARPGTIIVQHKNGFVCANAGIDHSNVQSPSGDSGDWVLLLPDDADHSAEIIREALSSRCHANIGVMIIDSHGRAWRVGTVGMCIGLAGLPGVVDLRGVSDLFGYQLRVTQVAAADELASAASLMMGEAAESTPVIHVRGFPYPLRKGMLQELIRPKELDLFR